MTRALAMRLADRYGSPLEFVGALRRAVRRSEKLSDQEVREIIGRAAEMQAEFPVDDGSHIAGSESIIDVDNGHIGTAAVEH